MSLFLETPDWVRPTDFPRLRGHVGFDFETVDPFMKTRGPSWAFSGIGKVIGAGVAMEVENRIETRYYPVGHQMGNMEDPDKVWAWLKHELEDDPDPTLELLSFNANYEMGWLRRYGIRPRCPVHDPGVAMALIDETRLSYNLNSIAQTILGDGKYSDDLRKFAEGLGVKDHMSQLDRLPPMYVGPYCEQDAALLIPLWRRLMQTIDARRLHRALQLEEEILPVVLDMRWRGIRINVPRLERYIESMRGEEAQILSDIKRDVGRGVEIWAQDSIADAMDLLGIEYPKTPAGRPSFPADWLEHHPHPVPQKIVRARKLNKVHGTFLQSYLLESQFNGRVHCTFTPLRSDEGGAVTGRFSCSDPNFQNLPSRSGEFAAIVRGMVLPEDGDRWGAFDYASQEPRLTVHFAAAAKCPGAEAAVEEYQKNPRID